MWVKVDERVIINVDSKVVKMVREDTPLKEGGTSYAIGFYNTLEKGAKPAYNYRWDTADQRDQAFNIVCQELSVIDTTRIKA